MCTTQGVATRDGQDAVTDSSRVRLKEPGSVGLDESGTRTPSHGLRYIRADKYCEYGSEGCMSHL